MSIYKLRIKIKSLAAEARIIRHEEHKLTRGHRAPIPPVDLPPQMAARLRGKTERRGMIPWARAHQAGTGEIEAMETEYFSLHRHRTYDLRNEARAAQLAYGYLRGKPYAVVESPTGRKPHGTIIATATSIANRFSPVKVKDKEGAESFLAWVMAEAAGIEPAPAD
jgi:hypothetical protein